METGATLWELWLVFDWPKIRRCGSRQIRLEDNAFASAVI